MAHHDYIVTVRADVHCHTSAPCDGAVEPVRLVELARECGLTHVAITDQETLAGALAARAAGVPSKPGSG